MWFVSKQKSRCMHLRILVYFQIKLKYENSKKPLNKINQRLTFRHHVI